MYKIIREQKALTHIREISEYYEARSEGLGDKFLNELETIIEKYITKHPKIYQIVHENIRQASLKRFEYKISFVVEETEKQIIILAVTHHKRDEREWRITNDE